MYVGKKIDFFKIVFSIVEKQNLLLYKYGKQTYDLKIYVFSCSGILLISEALKSRYNNNNI